MKIGIDDVPAVIGAFVDEELAPQAHGLQKAMLYGGLFVVQRQAGNVLASPDVQNRLKMAGVMDEAGLIDIDYAYDMARFALEKTGKVTALGITFDARDAEKLYQLAGRVAK